MAFMSTDEAVQQGLVDEATMAFVRKRAAEFVETSLVESLLTNANNFDGGLSHLDALIQGRAVEVIQVIEQQAWGSYT